MKIIIVLLTIVYLFISFPIDIFAQWTKYPQNPVFSPQQNSWDNQLVRCPSVILDNGIYKMWYSGYGGSYWNIGYATSVNGINWTRQLIPQISTTSYNVPNIIQTDEPTALKIGNEYKMWFKESTSTNYRHTIKYANSPDGVNWNIQNISVLEGTPNAWDDIGITNPSVLFDNNIYRLLYVSTGNGIPWSIGYATSANGQNWIKHSDNPLKIPQTGATDGPSLLKINDTYYLWYITGDSNHSYIYETTSTDFINWKCGENCSVITNDSLNTFDSRGISCPSVIQDGNQLKMWYSGFDGTTWKIGLATSQLPIIPTPTIVITNTPTPIPSITPSPPPSPSLTPSPTIIPTPTPTIEKPSIILIPGFFASWNKDAIIHNKSVNQSDWKLASFVKEYDGIIKTLENLGYKKNKDLYIFTYDWRKNINSIADDLNLYIKDKNKVILIGHSMGGLVSRIYTQKYGISKIEKLITIGSPHQGTAQTYKAVEAGDLDTSNTFSWLGQKLILELYKNFNQTDKQIINNYIPSLKDMFPTYSFLINEKNQQIPINTMKINNSLLLSYNQNIQSIFPIFQTMVGEKGNTLSGFNIKEQSLLDKILDSYPDGRPTQSKDQTGDYVITSNSAKSGNNPIILPLDHGEIIFKKKGIEEILKTGNICNENCPIDEGSSTKITPSLIFIIKSPAELEVQYNGTTYNENDGIIFISDASSGNYDLKVKGKEPGNYTVLIGQIGNQNNTWNTIEGIINSQNPTLQIDRYPIQYDNNISSISVFSPEQLFNELTLYLSNIDTHLLKYVNEAKKYYEKQRYDKTKEQLLKLHDEIFKLIQHTTNNDIKNKLHTSINKLEILYSKSLSKSAIKSNKLLLFIQLNIYKNIFLIKQKIIKLNNPDENVSIINAISNKIMLVEKQINTDIHYSTILLQTINELLKYQFH